VTSSITRSAFDVKLTEQSDDGMELHRDLDVWARDVGGLPSEAALIAEVRRAAGELEQIRVAPLAEDSNAPVLFEGPAAAEIVRDLLATELGGTPPEERELGGRFMTDRASGLSGKLGQRILPKGFRVVDDPTSDLLGTTVLFGGYKFDDEGVAAQKVLVVDDGVLKTLLMSRAPIKEIPHSNGHGLRPAFGSDIARGQIANLVISAAGGLTPADLRRKLLAEIAAEGATHGYVVRSLQGSRELGDPERPSRVDEGVRPLVMVEVDKDGKERFVRGASFKELTLRSLKDIVAAGRDPYAWSALMLPPGHGRLGGGGGPVSIASPALLFKDVEIRKHVGQEPRRPVLKHPFFP